MVKQIVELFGVNTERTDVDWNQIVADQHCPFLNKVCYKVRKSDSGKSIGTCTVSFGRPEPKPIMICPARLVEGGQIFTDCLHLLTLHEPGNELHLVPEVGIPGGSVDFFLISVKAGKVVDFVGIELQTLDTTGTVWPARQRLLNDFGITEADQIIADKSYAMNWKMTSKTILVQMHHKAETFEALNRKLVLVVEDRLLNYMKGEFRFEHTHKPASITDSVQFHAYGVGDNSAALKLTLVERISTDAEGVSQSLGMQAESRVELDAIVAALQARISDLTRFQPVGAAPTATVADAFGSAASDFDD
jgi:Restriction endonuclease NotI